MKNEIPKLPGMLFSMAGKAADGLHSQQTAIGIMHNTEAVVRQDLDSARTQQNAYQAAKTTRLAAVNDQTTADDAVSDFIILTRDIVKRVLGSRYSQAWDEVGFTNRSLGVPRTMDARLALVKAIQLYLKAHPAVRADSLFFTEARAEQLHGDLSSAVSAVNNAWSSQRTLKTQRDDAVNALQDRMRNLYRELKQFLAENDPRWLEFGFNVPGDSELPEMPDELIVLPSVSGHLLASWEASPRADRYHVYKQAIGVDTDFVLAKTVTETSADMNTFTPGMHVKVRVSAANDAGESAPTDAVEQVVG